MEWEKGHLQYLVEHVFLPPKLPHSYDAETEQKDVSLYQFVAHAGQKFREALKESEHDPSPSDLHDWKELDKMLRRTARIHQQHHLVKEEIESALENMKIGGALPLHIAAQNAGIIFRKVDDKHMTFEAFELSLPTEIVTGTVGKIIQRFPTNPRLPFDIDVEVISTLANVLSYLSHTTMDDAIPSTMKGGTSHQEVRQTVSPRYITEAISGVIRACLPETAVDVKTPYIWKRIDDHALWKSAFKPWRRTPSLLLLKVALQSTTREKRINEAQGYKTFWAFMMSLIMEEALQEDAQIFTMDLLHVMNVKLARRLAKLDKHIENDRILPLKLASATVHHVAEILESRWKQVQVRSSSVIQWSQLEVVSRSGFEVKFSNTQEHLRKVTGRKKALEKIAVKYDNAETLARLNSDCAPRLCNTDALPDKILTKEIDIALFDFEHWVDEHLPSWSGSSVRSESDCFRLFSIAEEYRNAASAYYKDDPERLSSMYLNLVELWVALDRIVCSWCSLLAEFSPEIPEDFLDPLLLPTFDQMKRLARVQRYLENRHEQARDHGYHSVFDNATGHNSFANRFFDCDEASSLILLESRIEQWADVQREVKLEEAEKMNEEYHSLMDEALSMQCKEQSYFDKRKNARFYGHAHWICKRCNTERKARKMRITPIEEPLPNQQTRSRATVFELECPLRIAVWRDMTVGILFPIKEDTTKQETDIYALETYQPLSQFFKSPYPDRLPAVGLASSTKSIRLSHYGRDRLFPVNDSSLIVKHAGNFRLFDRRSNCWLKEPQRRDLRTICTFQMEGPYRNLQTYVNSTTHLPNAVISSMHSCPSELPMSEYIAFSQLRAGKRIQWWNVMRAIRSQSLTFSEPSVVNLVLQSIWQAEWMGEAGVYRESHHELQDRNFGIDIADELLSAIGSLGTNWKQYLYASLLIALAIRLKEVSPYSEVREEADLVIQTSRELIKGWIKTLLDAAKDQQSSDQSQHTRQSVAAVAIVFRSTFDGATDFFSNEEAIWFIYTGMLAASETDSVPQSIRRLLLRDNRIALRVQSSLSTKCAAEPSILHKAVGMAWPGYVPGLSWQRLPSPADRWWMTVTKAGNGYARRSVHLNLINGTLLVDGTVSDRLPAEYISHPVYSALLKNHVFLEVHPSNMLGMTYQVHYHDSELHLGLWEEELLIRRRRDEKVEEYLPPILLQEDLPLALTSGHHYWYIEGREKIEIRPDAQAWESNNAGHWAVHLTYPKGTIRGQIQRATPSGDIVLLDPHSALYRSLSRALHPLEPRTHGLLVTRNLDDTLGVTSIYVPRHDLGFQLNQNGQLESHSLPGYVVNRDREGVGCLFGLDTFICLRPSDHRENALKILVPRGVFSSKVGQHGHPNLTIDVGDHAGYFVYDVDDLVGRLVGNRTIESDLYLVKLHAFTSAPFPDPLTRRPGTVEALDRLQSAASSSVLNISKESRMYLEDIAALTPIRTCYPAHLEEFKMETVAWNPSLPANSQHLSFRDHVLDILLQWRETIIFHQQNDLVEELDAPKGMVHLNVRAAFHFRSFVASNLVQVDTEDLQYDGRDSLTSLESKARERVAFQTADLTKQSTGKFPLCRTLTDTVLEWDHLQGNNEWKWTDIHQWLKSPQIPHISDMWCTLYELCRSTSWPPSFEVVVAIGLLGFSGISVEILASLVTIIYDGKFADDAYWCPLVEPTNLAEGSKFDKQAVKSLLRDCAKDITSSKEYQSKRRDGETADERMARNVKAYKEALEEEVDQAVEELHAYWKAFEDALEEELPDIGALISGRRLLDLSSSDARDAVQQKIDIWWENRAFLRHISLVKGVLNRHYSPLTTPALYSPTVPGPSMITAYGARIYTLHGLMSTVNPALTSGIAPNASVLDQSTTKHKPVVELEELLAKLKTFASSPFERQYLQHLKNSVEALQSPRLTPPLSAYYIDSLASRREKTWKTARGFFESIKKALTPVKHGSKLIRASGMWPNITPIVLLRCLSIKQRSEIPSRWFKILVGYATCVHDAKRYDRILNHAHAQRNDQLALEQHYSRTWDPLAHPDWLLFEIDTNVSIRAAQSALAMEMINPHTEKNAIMQLNMGEGKSSVIVPIVAATIGAKESILPRVIVPRAQTKQQFQFLRRALTSLCDRPVVYLPFNRQLEFTPQIIEGIHEFLRKLAATGGVWLCEPEQLLSLKLLGLDKMLRRTTGVDNGGSGLIQLQSWLNGHSQDILDESDEVLQTRQQVIYTVGDQKPLDASPRRWEIIQRLLSLLSSYLVKRSEAGEDLTGVYVESSQEKIAGFPHIRIQSESGRLHLRHFIETAFKDHEWSLPQSLTASAVDFITSTNPTEETLDSIKEYCVEDPQLKHTLLVLRGMIAYDILMHGLKDKRWRVEYGLDLNRSRLAIPYRAKDFPSLRSEFGHPDVTILLTCLSYYYAGLDDDMVRRAVKRLLRSATPDLTYGEWLKSCWSDVPRELQTIRGISMDDDQVLATNLFPFLRHNKVVINFYLNSFVFPRQAREFPFKLLSSGWDIAAQKKHTTTGFSGTNDIRFLLPTPIEQVDRASQLHTNAKVLSRLLLEENEIVIQYPDDFKSAQLLDRICELWDRPTVILDVGAQILDQTNLEFSRSWLARYDEDSQISAVVFFDEAGNLLVLTRDGSTIPFLDSPYSNTLDRCLVYLDDAHTRGTDLRLPSPSQAVVTLGPRLTKDKLVQGCMRMRRLGDGHTLLFMASEEVVKLITDATGCSPADITSTEVVIWTIRESWRQAQADLPAWVQQGKSFMRRDAAWKELENSNNSEDRLHSLFCEPEARSLESLYGVDNDVGRDLMRGIDMKNGMGQLIAKRCKDFGSFSIYDTAILEEMEVELVHEKENEREVQEIPSARPARHTIDMDVIEFITKAGTIPPKSHSFLRIQEALAHSSLKIPIGIDQVFNTMRVTRDFFNTIILDGTPIPGVMDHFLRPVEWIITKRIANKRNTESDIAVVLSPYEVDQLLPRLRESAFVTLHLFAPRNNLSMRTMEDLDCFVLPKDPYFRPIPRSLGLQINLFAGSIYLRDHATYKAVCIILRLHFGELPPHLAKPEIIDLRGFVKNPLARLELGMVGQGFKTNAIPLFQKLLVLRRHGQGLGPSHMGKLLHGTKLHKGKNRDFDEDED